ncbi:MAG TPA: 50S ribosomal protein L9 [Spirochaetota bacterium]|nr:50S ribosomal protein L9 [Spirochaetota bacterium]HPN83261.1 50S ribosomal protein L9 [Spirochaetota bacterium]
MEVILKADVSGLGEEGDIKNVAPGYARNYLLPKGFALPKTATNLKWLDRQKQAILKRKEEKALAARDMAQKISDLSVTVTGKVSSGNRLYGSIHAHEISVALKEMGVEIDARKIEVGEPIKHLGDFTVTIKLYEGVQSKLKVHVTSVHGDAEEYTARPVAAQTSAAEPVDEAGPDAETQAEG